MVSAFSFGTGKKSSDQIKQKAFVPGPGAYNPIKKQKKEPPCYKIGSGSRSNLLRAFAPGPGAYQPPERMTKEGPKYSFGSRYQQQARMFSPGPGAYNPKNQQREQPKYTMGSKLSESQIVERSKIPGPGTYESKSTVLGVPSNKFGHDQRQGFTSQSKVPGPGSYMLKRPSSAGPRYGFGSQARDSTRDLKRIPGPGTYEADSQFQLNRSKGFTMISRRNQQGEQYRPPGPGAYNPEKKQKYQPPSYKIGTENRHNLSKETVRVPGPGSYEAHYEFSRPQSAQVRIGSAQRKPLTESSYYQPGPGAYEYQSRVGEGPKVQMLGQKYDPIQKQRENMPGPGQYNPSVQQVKQRPSSAKIGSGNRSDFTGNKGVTNPGVGNYNLRGNAEGPVWGFGSMVRPALSKPTETPGNDVKQIMILIGPGGYNLKPTFADVPSYLLPKKY